MLHPRFLFLSRNRLDTLCVLLLIGLWALFFWRLITPTKANQLSLVDGDFSGQFVAYAGYQAERLSQGQIPLWIRSITADTRFWQIRSPPRCIRRA